MKDERSNLSQKTGWGCSCLLAAIFGPLLAVILVYLGLVGLGSILIVADPIEPVNAVVILSGDDGNRLATAVELRERGYVSNLVITDTTSAANNRLAREAREAGFPAEAIYKTNLKVDSTKDEAIAVREFALNRGWDALMIVTDPYHSFRTRIIFRRELRGSGIEVYVRPVVGHWFKSSTWFYSSEGWRFVALEIAKLINYFFFQL